MVNCPKCGKELKHKGALNGHLAFAHGVITPRQLKMDELRGEVKKLHSEIDYIKRYLTGLESVYRTGKHIGYLTGYHPIEVCRNQLAKRELDSRIWRDHNSSCINCRLAAIRPGEQICQFNANQGIQTIP